MGSGAFKGMRERSMGEGAARAGEDDRAATVPRRAGRTYGGATSQGAGRWGSVDSAAFPAFEASEGEP
jgi:hypothetical protein